MNLIQLGKFVLSSGKESDFKLECDQFIKENLEGLVHIIKKMQGRYQSVTGVPRGGILLAESLKHGVSEFGDELIVDDVLTTGESMEKARCRKADVKGIVIFARGPCPHWVRAIFQMPECLWD